MRRPWILASLSSVLMAFMVPLVERASGEDAASKAAILEQVVAPDVEAAPPDEPLTEHEAQAVDPAGTDPLEEPLTCLARAIYWEAKGNPGPDMESVANVIMNRLAHEEFPNTICEVVTQGPERGPCQFSWWCDGRPDEVVESDAYEIARETARRALNQELPDTTDGALYFHDRSVLPHWAHEFQMTLETDAFLFYRPR